MPYILIVLSLIIGFFIKDYFDVSKTDNTEKLNNNSNIITQQFETLLIYPKKNKLPAFQLIDQFNQKFINENLEGRWNFIFSGYTNCPDVCPVTLSKMAELYKLLSAETKNKVQFIFLSVDPARDTPEHLKDYVGYFNQNFIGVSGEKSQIDPLIKSLGGIYSINQSEGEFYTVDHSSRIFIVGPQARRYGLLDSQIINKNDKEPLINDINKLINND